jgi:hypothetical protein
VVDERDGLLRERATLVAATDADLVAFAGQLLTQRG